MSDGHRTIGRLTPVLERIYATAPVRRPEFDGSAVLIGPSPSLRDHEVTMTFTVLAEDDDELVRVCATVIESLEMFGVDVVGEIEHLAVRDVPERTVRTAGVSYDERSGVLTIDTWGPSWHDLEISIFPAGQLLSSPVDDRDRPSGAQPDLTQSGQDGDEALTEGRSGPLPL